MMKKLFLFTLLLLYSATPARGMASKIFITTTSDTDSFNFSMSAAGTFTIDWGDGLTEKITRTDTEQTTYSHN